MVFCVGFGTAMATAYIARLALVNPDVTWSRTKNPEPWERYRNKQYKVFMIYDQQYSTILYAYFSHSFSCMHPILTTQHWNVLLQITKRVLKPNKFVQPFMIDVFCIDYKNYWNIQMKTLKNNWNKGIDCVENHKDPSDQFSLKSTVLAFLDAYFRWWRVEGLQQLLQILRFVVRSETSIICRLNT